MSPRLLSRQNTIKRDRINVVQTKRQRILLSGFPRQFTAKHYPCIFLDQRLKSRFNERTIYKA